MLSASATIYLCTLRRYLVSREEVMLVLNYLFLCNLLQVMVMIQNMSTIYYNDTLVIY